MNNSNDCEYQEYLEKIQISKSTDEKLIRDVVFEGTGSQTYNLSRIISGEINEVYEVELEKGENVIARINTSNQPTFDQESWALTQCEKNGIPVPRVIFIKQIPYEHGYKSFCIQEKLNGQPLGIGQNILEINNDDLNSILYQAGNILSRIHSIPVYGFGHLNGEGHGTHKSFNEVLISRIENSDKYMKLFYENGFSFMRTLKMFKIIEEFVNKEKQITPFMVHGDFGPKHIMFEGSKVVGILDFGDVLGSSPVYDFARWEYFYGRNKMYSVLQDGYHNENFFKSGDFMEISKIIQLDTGLITLEWYCDQKYKKGIDYSVDKINEILSNS